MLKLEYTTQLLKTEQVIKHSKIHLTTSRHTTRLSSRYEHIHTTWKPPFALKSGQKPVQKTFSVFQLVLYSVLLYRQVSHLFLQLADSDFCGMLFLISLF